MHPHLDAPMALLAQAQARFASARADYAALRARSRRQAVREEWFDASHHAPAPLALQRLGLVPGVRLAHVPSARARAGTCRYGLDPEGRVCLEEQYTGFPDRAYEEFWDHQPDRIVTARFDYFEPDKDPINVQIVPLEGGPAAPRPAALVRYAQHGIALEAYEYDAPTPSGRLLRVHAAAREHDPASPQHAWMLTVDDVHRDRAGAVRRIERTWSGGVRETIFPPRS